MNQVIIFILSFIVVLIIYETFIITKAKKDNTKKPVEVKLLVNMYKLNLKKVNYNQLLQIIALISSFDIALIALIVSCFKKVNIQILVGILVTIPIMLVSYKFVSNYYKGRDGK